MPDLYEPPFAVTPRVLDLVVRISEEIGRRGLSQERALTPALRRGNRLRSIQASLAIENNSLSLEQVTAVVAGKRVLGPPQEIQEVRNAFAAYEAMEGWQPGQEKHLLAAHRLMMQGLTNDAGRWRRGAVGIAQGAQVVHMAPPAGRVPGLMKDLLGWLKRTDVHPLVAGCVFHYELEFIHPFSDGNGRMGRLWQTLILSRWKPLLAWLPVESVIRDRQVDYYAALAAADKAGASTVFIEFLLAALLEALLGVPGTDQVTDPVSDQVKALLKVLGNRTLSGMECMKKLGLAHRPTFRQNYLQPALRAGLVERTLPDKPNSRLQKYRRALPRSSQA
ncbi:MAG: Fic family protein [Verrucomicrobiaceae bacterium]|nr:Fic family protein [Verrucomicrobiaceae bacterium]